MGQVLVAGHVSLQLRGHIDHLNRNGFQAVEIKDIVQALEGALSGDYDVVVIEAIEDPFYASDLVTLIRSIPGLSHIACIVSARQSSDMTFFELLSHDNVQIAIGDDASSFLTIVDQAFRKVRQMQQI
jgi:hypothetical protein